MTKQRNGRTKQNVRSDDIKICLLNVATDETINYSVCPDGQTHVWIFFCRVSLFQKDASAWLNQNVARGI